jgi:hypothetical protein
MNEPPTRTSGTALAARQQTQNRRQNLAGLAFMVVAVAILFILPEYLTPPIDVLFMGLGAAAMLTVFLYLYPDSLRSRSGSLVTAYGLVAALWVLAIFSTVVSFLD